MMPDYKISIESQADSKQVDFVFQAPKFYQHLGYKVFEELEDFPLGHRRFFLKKSLQNNL